MPLGILSRRRSSRTSPPPHLRAPIPQGAGALDLTVHDPVGLPLSAAKVTLTESGGHQLMTGQTDPHGRFTATLPPASYEVLVTADGYQPVRSRTSVGDGSRTPLPTITMEVAPAPPLPTAGEWQIDPSHSSVRFISRHIGLAHVHGRFNDFQGRVTVAPNAQDSEVEVLIHAASIDTGMRLRDDHLRSADFLDVERYPYLHFHSSRFVHRGGTRWAVQGALELRGVSRSVTLDTRYLGVGTGIQGETRTACSAGVELHREDFTLNWRKMLDAGIAAIGSSIRVELDIQAVPAPPGQA
ncbi:YceI family protein [Streptomyces sp. HNM0574]|uniref:YceI family protein n=1 Tax=Streptomyces sp. HNM0574 TaxID=2714954 RepID=UPI00146DF3C1|nr:YceI family protein [Streptomyces sp. HNM0574]NLU70361.1 hypothetical protein [Streptomyces sp. HNM0574]